MHSEMDRHLNALSTDSSCDAVRLGLFGILKSRGITQLVPPWLDGEVLRTAFLMMVSTLRGFVNAVADMYALTMPDRWAFSMTSI